MSPRASAVPARAEPATAAVPKVDLFELITPGKVNRMPKWKSWLTPPLAEAIRGGGDASFPAILWATGNASCSGRVVSGRQRVLIAPWGHLCLLGRKILTLHRLGA